MGDLINNVILLIEDDNIKIMIDDVIYIKEYVLSDYTLVCG